MGIRFSRHARNKSRLYRLTDEEVEEVEEVIRSGERLNQGDKVESRLGNLRVIWLIVGSYTLVVTVIKTERR